MLPSYKSSKDVKLKAQENCTEIITVITVSITINLLAQQF